MKRRLFKNLAKTLSISFVPRLGGLVTLLLVVSMAEVSNAAMIDVTQYGAVPNDSVDDSLAIQNAINSAPDHSTIYFPPGTYLVADVKIDKRVGLTLTGAGSTLTVLKRNGSYPKIFESTGSAEILVTQMGFDVNGILAYGGFNFYDAKRITITKTHFFDSNKQPVGSFDRFSWVFGRGSVPSEDILIKDNLVEDLQLEVDFGLRVRIEGNTVARPVATAGIGVFTINDNTAAQYYTIQGNTIVDPLVSAAGIVVHLDPPSTKYATMKNMRIINNNIVYTKYISGAHASAIRLGTGDSSQATIGNVFDDIVIEGNVIYKDPGGAYDFGDVNAIIFGNSSASAKFQFDNITVRGNVIYYNSTIAIPSVDIRQKGVNYVENNNPRYAIISADMMPPSRPIALTAIQRSDTRINLAWNESLDNVGVYRYRIYRNDKEIAGTVVPLYEDRNLSPMASYTYAVTAIDLSGNESSQSYSITATTSSPTALGPISTPQSLIVSGTSETRVHLSWDAPANGTAIRYRIYRDGVHITNDSGTTHESTGLSPGTTYTFVIYAVDSADNISPASNSVLATTGSPTASGPISAPQHLIVSGTSETRARLSWDAPANGTAIRYRIYRDGVHITNDSGTTHESMGLSPGTTYTFVIYAVDSAGNISPASSSVLATTSR